MSDYPDRVWISAQPAPTVTAEPRDGAQEYIRADIARYSIRLVVSIAEGYGIDRAEILRALQFTVDAKSRCA